MVPGLDLDWSPPNCSRRPKCLYFLCLNRIFLLPHRNTSFSPTAREQILATTGRSGWVGVPGEDVLTFLRGFQTCLDHGEGIRWVPSKKGFSETEWTCGGQGWTVRQPASGHLIPAHHPNLRWRNLLGQRPRFDGCCWMVAKGLQVMKAEPDLVDQVTGLPRGAF